MISLSTLTNLINEYQVIYGDENNTPQHMAMYLINGLHRQQVKEGGNEAVLLQSAVVIIDSWIKSGNQIDFLRSTAGGIYTDSHSDFGACEDDFSRVLISTAEEITKQELNIE